MEQFHQLYDTFRYSTMLAENLVDNYKPVQQEPSGHHLSLKNNGVDQDGTVDSQTMNDGRKNIVAGLLSNSNL